MKQALTYKFSTKRISFFVICALFFVTLASAQTADEIIHKHFEATGGEKAWNQLNSIVIKGVVTVDVSDAIPIVIEHKRPYFKRVSYIVNGEEQLSEGFDGKNAFTYNNLDGKYKKLSGYQQDAFETDILNYDKKGFVAEKISTESVNGREAYKVKLTKNTEVDLYWFAVDDFQLLKEENDIETVMYGDFRDVEGLNFAHRMEATPKGGAEYVVIFEEIIPNAAIDEDRFKFD